MTEIPRINYRYYPHPKDEVQEIIIRGPFNEPPANAPHKITVGEIYRIRYPLKAQNRSRPTRSRSRIKQGTVIQIYRLAETINPITIVILFKRLPLGRDFFQTKLSVG